MSTDAAEMRGPARGGQLATPVTVRGVRYPSITAAARAYGIDPLVVISRRRLGWEILSAVTTPVKRACRAVMVRGQSYRSVSAAAAALGVPYGRVMSRLREGWEVERAFSDAASQMPPNARALRVEGKRYRSIAAAAESSGLDPMVVRARIQQGWSLKRALSTPVREISPSRPVTIKGKRYPSIFAAARAHGQPGGRVRERVARGWTIERAVSEPLLTKGGHPIGVHFQGRTYESLDAAARSLGVSPHLVRGLRSQGLSDAKALGRALERERELARRLERREAFKAQAGEHTLGGLEIEFEGVRYASTSALARAYGVLSPTLRARMRQGWTLEQALGQASPPKLVRHLSAVRVAGEEFVSISAAARRFGVSWSVARYRLQIGATPEQAFGLAPFEARVAQTGKRISVGGERFASISEACRRWQKSPALIQKRLAAGESPEQAFDLEPPPLEHAAVVVGGRPFRFLAAAARHFQVPEGSLRALVGKGVDPQVAVGMILTGRRRKTTVRKVSPLTSSPA